MKHSVCVFFGATLVPDVDHDFDSLEDAADFAAKYRPDDYPDATVVIVGPDGQLTPHAQEAALLRVEARGLRRQADEQALYAREEAFAQARARGDSDVSLWSWAGAGDELSAAAGEAEAEAEQHDAADARTPGAPCPFEGDAWTCGWCARLPTTMHSEAQSWA